VTAALSAPARALLADLQGVNAMGEGFLKSWGSKRRPQLPLSRVEALALELVDAGLATREVLSDGRSKYRARERSPEPPPVEVVTEPVSLTTLHAWGKELLAHLRSVPEAKTADLAAWGAAHVPPLELHQVEGLVDELIKSGKVASEVKRGGPRRDRVRYRAVPVEVVTEPGWIPRVDAEGSFFGVARSEPAWHGGSGRRKKAPPVAPEAPAHGFCDACGAVVVPPQDLCEDCAPHACAECARLAEALLSWERLWGPEGTDLAAMEERIRTAERERDEARAAALAKTTTPVPPPSLSPNAFAALAILSTSRGTSPHEIAARSRILRRSVPHALAELRAAGVAIETTPGLWRRKLWVTSPTPVTPPWRAT
jgi:hypothetical protein